MHRIDKNIFLGFFEGFLLTVLRSFCYQFGWQFIILSLT